MIKDILKMMKVNHYIKNLIVFVPLIFSINFLNKDLLLNACIMCISFCLISSSVYIMNDLIDINSDKMHPIKSKRPIASGRITVEFASLFCFMLVILSALLSLNINLLSMLMVLIYFVLNVFYSVKLKNIVIIDAVCIALGFIIRILGGCYAISVSPSALIILLTFFLSLFFTFSKRKIEKLTVEEGSQRKAIKDLDLGLINQFIQISVTLSLAFYMSYMTDTQTIMRAGTKYLYVTAIPFTIIIFRLLFLLNNLKEDDPIHCFERDTVLKLMILGYFIVFGVVIAL